MAAITAAEMVSLIDKWTAWYLALKGTDASGYGTGNSSSTAGAWFKANEMEAIVADDIREWDVSAVLGANVRQLRDRTAATAVGAALGTSLLYAFNAACERAAIDGVSDLDTFATYYNLTDTTKWQCQLPPDFVELYAAMVGTGLSPWNVYAEVMQGATYANGLGKLMVGTGFMTGASIASATYAGGFGQLKTDTITGSGVVTVTGLWRLTDGTTEADDGTATVDGNSTFVLTPPDAGALLLSVSNIAAAGGITAGNIYAEAALPSGRSNPPT